MTGEMGRAEVTPDAFPLHFAIAKALRGTVEPFDVYQGPYVFVRRTGRAYRLWVSADDGPTCRVWAERSGHGGACEHSGRAFIAWEPDAPSEAVESARTALRSIRRAERRRA